jgi:phage baseplate assembly protein W
MATYIGYNTINQYKTFVLTDYDLVRRDLLNYFNIREGEKVGRPEVGTRIWNFIFEPQTTRTETGIRDEVLRVVSKDPRVGLNDIKVYPQNNGILVELEVTISGLEKIELINLFFDETTRRATLA